MNSIAPKENRIKNCGFKSIVNNVTSGQKTAGMKCLKSALNTLAAVNSTSVSAKILLPQTIKLTGKILKSLTETSTRGRKGKFTKMMDLACF